MLNMYLREHNIFQYGYGLHLDISQMRIKTFPALKTVFIADH